MPALGPRPASLQPGAGTAEVRRQAWPAGNSDTRVEGRRLQEGLKRMGPLPKSRPGTGLLARGRALWRGCTPTLLDSCISAVCGPCAGCDRDSQDGHKFKYLQPESRRKPSKVTLKSGSWNLAPTSTPGTPPSTSSRPHFFDLVPPAPTFSHRIFPVSKQIPDLL